MRRSWIRENSAGGVYGVAFSPDGKQLASASIDMTVKLWDATNGREKLTLKGHTDSAWSVAFSAEGKRLASASDDQTVKIWDAMSRQATLSWKGHNGGVTSVAFSPDGKWLVPRHSLNFGLEMIENSTTLRGPQGGGLYAPEVCGSIDG